MIELEHADLFKPPAGTRIVVVPVCGEHWPKPPNTLYTPMNYGYAALAKARWKSLHIVVGVLTWNVGPTPHPLTVEKPVGSGGSRIMLPGKQGKKLPMQYHLVSLPTRRYAAQAIDIDFLNTQLHALHSLCGGKIPWLAEGQVVLPQICDPQHGKTWEQFRRYAEIWLPEDRYVFITGKEGLVT